LTVILGLTAALLWGVPDVPLAVAVRRLGTIPVIVGSLALGLVVAAPIILLVTPGHAITTDGVLLAALAGAVSIVAYLAASTAFQTCPVSVVTPILSCEGAVAAVIAVATGEQLSIELIVLLACAVTGAVLVGLGGSGRRESGYLRGIAFVSLGAVLWGGVLALGSPVSHSLGVWRGFLLARAFTLAFGVAIALATGHGRSLAPALRAEPWRIAAWGLGDMGAYLAFYLAAHRGPVAVADVLAAQFATFGALSGIVLLNERLRRHQWAGVALVIAAVTAIAAAGY